MMSKPIFKLRTVLSLATLSACMLGFAPAAQAGLLGGVTGGAGGTLSPRQLDLNGQGRANVARDGKAQLPRGDKLRDAAGSTTGEAKGSLGAAKGAAADQAQQTQGAATAGGAIALEKAGGAKGGAADAAATAGKSSGSASASGSAGVKREGGAVNASASGEAGVSR